MNCCASIREEETGTMDGTSNALSIYRSLRGDDRATTRKRILALAGRPANSALVDVLGVDPSRANATLSDDADAIVTAAVREWWHRASTDAVTLLIDSHDDPCSRELAIVLCAESVAHLTDDPRVAECRRVRLAWVRGEASDLARDAAKVAASYAGWGAAWGAASGAASDAASDAASYAAWDGVWDAANNAARVALAAPLRTLYPDPTRLDWRDALTRWDVAVSEAQAAMKAFGGAR